MGRKHRNPFIVAVCASCERLGRRGPKIAAAWQLARAGRVLLRAVDEHQRGNEREVVVEADLRAIGAPYPWLGRSCFNAPQRQTPLRPPMPVPHEARSAPPLGAPSLGPKRVAWRPSAGHGTPR